MKIPLVAVVSGSKSDAGTVQPCLDELKKLRIPYEHVVISAHRNPRGLANYCEHVESRGVKVVIAAAGMAAHLPGVIAAQVTIPVLGIPVASGALGGLDALLSIVQMPGGVPVGTLAIGPSGSRNAASLAARILALTDESLRSRLRTQQVEAGKA